MNMILKPKGVSVVIPTLNRDAVLLDTLRDLLVQEFDDYEILVVDQSPAINIDVLDLARKHPDLIRYFHASFRGLPQARNFGWQKAEKDIVLYVDDDIRAGAGLLKAHYLCYTDESIGVVAGCVEEKGNKEGGMVGKFFYWTATPKGNFFSDKSGWVDHAKGCNFSCRKRALEASNGLDETLNVGAALYEELELIFRIKSLGYRVWFEPTARLHHLAAPSGGCRVERDWPRYMYGLAHNRAIMIYRHLRAWHRPTALARLVLLGLSYSRVDRSLRPLAATIRGIGAGRIAAAQPPLNSELQARECISS